LVGCHHKDADEGGYEHADDDEPGNEVTVNVVFLCIVTILPDDVGGLRRIVESDRVTHKHAIFIGVAVVVQAEFLALSFFKSDKGRGGSSKLVEHIVVTEHVLDLVFGLLDFIPLLGRDCLASCLQLANQFSVVERELDIGNFNFRDLLHSLSCLLLCFFVKTEHALLNQGLGEVRVHVFLVQICLQELLQFVDEVIFQAKGGRKSLVSILYLVFVIGALPVVVHILVDLVFDGVVSSGDCGEVPLQLLDFTALAQIHEHIVEEHADQDSHGHNNRQLVVLGLPRLLTLLAGKLHEELTVFVKALVRHL